MRLITSIGVAWVLFTMLAVGVVTAIPGNQSIADLWLISVAAGLLAVYVGGAIGLFWETLP